jgi:hypothetical protein
VGVAGAMKIGCPLIPVISLPGGQASLIPAFLEI